MRSIGSMVGRVGIARLRAYGSIPGAAGAMPTRSGLAALRRGQNRIDLSVNMPAVPRDFAHPTDCSLSPRLRIGVKKFLEVGIDL